MDPPRPPLRPIQSTLVGQLSTHRLCKGKCRLINVSFVEMLNANMTDREKSVLFINRVKYRLFFSFNLI